MKSLAGSFQTRFFAVDVLELVESRKRKKICETFRNSDDVCSGAAHETTCQRKKRIFVECGCRKIDLVEDKFLQSRAARFLQILEFEGIVRIEFAVAESEIAEICETRKVKEEAACDGNLIQLKFG